MKIKPLAKDVTFTKAKQEAEKLLQKLMDRANKNPRVFGENYGQNEVRDFSDSVRNTNLTYQEQCAVKDIVNRISSFSPGRGLQNFHRA